MSALPLPVNRLEEFDNCREAWRKCQARLKKILKALGCSITRAYTEAMLTEYADFFRQVESSPLNPAQARAVVNGEHSLLVLAGAGSGKTSVLVARAGWLLARGEASLSKFYCWRLVAKPLKRWTSVFANGYIPKTLPHATFHALALHIIQQGSKKVPIVSKLENDTAARHELFIAGVAQAMQRKESAGEGLAAMADGRNAVVSARR